MRLSTTVIVWYICSLCLSGGVIIVFNIGISSLINMEEDDIFIYIQMQKK